MFLVLGMFDPVAAGAGDDPDPSLTWVCTGLATRGLAPIVYLSAETLMRSPGWEHCVSENGMSYSRITLPDGRGTLDTREVHGTLNRLWHVPVRWSARAIPADRDYAASELHAFFLSWLSALPEPVVNRPSPMFLGGPYLQAMVWMALAARAGLFPVPYRYQSASPSAHPVVPQARTQTLFVVGSRVIAPDTGVRGVPPADVCAGCQRLATSVGASLLGVEFIRETECERWTFRGAHGLPDLRAGGEALLDALALLLAGAQRERHA